MTNIYIQIYNHYVFADVKPLRGFVCWGMQFSIDMNALMGKICANPLNPRYLRAKIKVKIKMLNKLKNTAMSKEKKISQ